MPRPGGRAEGGTVRRVGRSPLAGGGAGPWRQGRPAWRADGHGFAFAQGLVVFGGLAAAVVVLRRLLANSRSAWVGASALAITLAIAGRWLVAAPA